MLVYWERECFKSICYTVMHVLQCQDNSQKFGHNIDKFRPFSKSSIEGNLGRKCTCDGDFIHTFSALLQCYTTLQNPN